jgi:opacity protein-like surface antigen
MKKFLIVLALTVASFANAQKGTYLVSGNMSFWFDKSSVNGNELKSKHFNFSPNIGYQFKDNWTVGVNAHFSSSKDEYTFLGNNVQNNNFQETKTKGFSAGAFVRYSKSLSQTFLLYADLGAGYRNSKDTSTSLSQPQTHSKKTTDGIYASFAPGLFLNIKNNFGLNFGIGGLSYSNTNNDQNNENGSKLSFNFGQSFTAGISKNF